MTSTAKRWAVHARTDADAAPVLVAEHVTALDAGRLADLLAETGVARIVVLTHDADVTPPGPGEALTAVAEQRRATLVEGTV